MKLSSSSSSSSTPCSVFANAAGLPRTHSQSLIVSVIIPTYNCGDFIGDALRSVAIQASDEFGFDEMEVIVVDDRSTDDTFHAVKNSGVPCRYVPNERTKGPAGARNQGILLSSGKYIAFLDADDAWLPNKLSTQIDALESDPELLAISAEMLPWDDTTTRWKVSSSIRRYGFDEMVVRNRLGTPSVMCRRDALVQVGMFDESMNISEDYDLWLRLSAVGVVGRIESPLVRFRQRIDGASAGDRDRTHRLDWKYAKSIKNRYPDVPGVKRFVNQGLSARALDRAIELCDVERRYWDALRETVRSCWNWPWYDPMGTKRPLVRLRRVRRILIDALTSKFEPTTQPFQ